MAAFALLRFRPPEAVALPGQNLFSASRCRHLSLVALERCSIARVRFGFTKQVRVFVRNVLCTHSTDRPYPSIVFRIRICRVIFFRYLRKGSIVPKLVAYRLAKSWVNLLFRPGCELVRAVRCGRFIIFFLIDVTRKSWKLLSRSRSTRKRFPKWENCSGWVVKSCSTTTLWLQ